MTKRISAIILIACLLACLIFLAGCEVVSEIPISVEYIPAYDAMETQYEYKYDAWNGKFVMLPVLKMIHHEEQYKVKYEVTYSDGSKATTARTVDKATYEEAKRAIAEREG